MKNRFEEFNFAVAVFILLFIFFIFSKTVYAQDEIIRIDTNLVTVPVTVLDREGRYVTNLKKEDVQIFEDGVEQEIALFETVEQPITVFLLLDVSGSMVYHLTQLTNASNVFANELRPNDQLIAATFGEEIKLLLPLIKVKDLQKGIKLRPMATYRDTMVYDAVEFAQKKMKKISGRKAIVLFSDGVGSGLSASAKSNLRDAEEQEALIYTVQFAFSPPIRHGNINEKMFDKWGAKASIYMKNLAAKTGGRPYQIEKITDLEKTFRLIAEELRQQYSLGYYPKQTGKDGERRAIKVRVNVPNVAVRARDNYIVESSKKTRQK